MTLSNNHNNTLTYRGTVCNSYLYDFELVRVFLLPPKGIFLFTYN
jgi:hypothetical protein